MYEQLTRRLFDAWDQQSRDRFNQEMIEQSMSPGQKQLIEDSIQREFERCKDFDYWFKYYYKKVNEQ
jgi:hypothetical protein